MTRSIWLGMVVTAALSLGAMGCGDSGGSTATQADGGTSGTQQDGGSSSAACDHSGFDAALEYIALSGDTMYYSAQSSSAEPFDLLAIEIYNGQDTVGSHPLGATPEEQDYLSCTLCVLVRRGCSGADACAGKVFLATSGTLNITAPGAPGERFAATLEDVVLSEIDDTGDQAMAPIANGETWCLDTTVSKLVGCNSSQDCNSLDQGAVCDTAQHTCVECLTNADCTGNISGSLCNPDGNYCAGCLTDGDCTGGKLCSFGACTAPE